MPDFAIAAVGGGYSAALCGPARVRLSLRGMPRVTTACRAPRGTPG
jgi:hypothetical protein